MSSPGSGGGFVRVLAGFVTFTVFATTAVFVVLSRLVGLSPVLSTLTTLVVVPLLGVTGLLVLMLGSLEHDDTGRVRGRDRRVVERIVVVTPTVSEAGRLVGERARVIQTAGPVEVLEASYDRPYVPPVRARAAVRR